MSMYTWSGMISISMMSTEIFAAYSRRSSFHRVSIPFVKILRLYLGHHTTWYLQEETKFSFFPFRLQV